MIRGPLIESWHDILRRQIVRFGVANLRNSGLLRAICALNRTIFHHNLLAPDSTRGPRGPLIESWHDILRRQIVRFGVANLRNSGLLRAICALNRTIFHHNLLAPDSTRGPIESWHDILRRQIVRFGVANLRNSGLLRAICALNRTIFHHNLLAPDSTRSPLGSNKSCGYVIATSRPVWTAVGL